MWFARWIFVCEVHCLFYLKQYKTISLFFLKYTSGIIVAFVWIVVHPMWCGYWKGCGHYDYPGQTDCTEIRKKFRSKNLICFLFVNRNRSEWLLEKALLPLMIYIAFAKNNPTYIKAFCSVRNDMLVTGCTTAKNLSNDIKTNVYTLAWHVTTIMYCTCN